MLAILNWRENVKTDKYGKHCNDQRKHFSPFVLSVYGILGRQALVVLEQLSLTMAERRNEPLSHLRAWINGQIEIAVAKYYSHMIRGAQLTSHLQDRDPD